MSGSDHREPRPADRRSGSAVVAAIVLALESLAIAVLTLWQIVAVVGGDTVSIASALALVVLTAVFAVAVGSFAVAVIRGRSWGRSGGVVTQVLVLAVALGALTGQYAHPLFALVLAAPAAIGLTALWSAAREAGRRAREQRGGEQR